MCLTLLYSNSFLTALPKLKLSSFLSSKRIVLQHASEEKLCFYYMTDKFVCYFQKIETLRSKAS